MSKHRKEVELEACAQGLAKTHPWVLRAVIQYFNFGPTSHHIFDRLIWAIAHGQ